MNRRFTVPNVITALRVLMAFAALWLAVSVGADRSAVLICVVAAMLDGFDGWYARSFDQCSRVGEHMDPLADKILMGVVYGWLGIDTHSAVVWVLIGMVAARDVAMTAFRAYSLRRHGRYIPASGLGRRKMLVQSVAGLSILSATHLAGLEVPRILVGLTLTIILVLSYASAAAYVANWKRAARKEAAASQPTAPRVAANS